MNVLFVDIDGVLGSTRQEDDRLFMEEKIIILKKMCDLYHAKVVISSSHKPVADNGEEEGESPTILRLYDLFKKHNIDFLGFTPRIRIETSANSTIDSWKDFEIIYYLMNHPEIEHFAILDDENSYDLALLKKYLVAIGFYDERGNYHEGLQVGDIIRVRKALELDNPYSKLIEKVQKDKARRRKPRKE